MEKVFNPDEYKEVRKRVKLIVGKDADEADKRAAEFEKQHNVIDVIQKSPNVIILFYTEQE